MKDALILVKVPYPPCLLIAVRTWPSWSSQCRKPLFASRFEILVSGLVALLLVKECDCTDKKGLLRIRCHLQDAGCRKKTELWAASKWRRLPDKRLPQYTGQGIHDGQHLRRTLRIVSWFGAIVGLIFQEGGRHSLKGIKGVLDLTSTVLIRRQRLDTFIICFICYVFTHTHTHTYVHKYRMCLCLW